MREPKDAEGARETRKAEALRVSLFAAALAVLSCLVPAAAAADPNPGNDSDQLTISVTPAADVGVVIDTANVTLDFAMALGATAYTLSPTTVTIVGNIHPQELNISAQNIGPSAVWTLDADEVAGADQFQLYGLFSATRQAAPSEAEFAGTKNLITTTPTRAGKQTGAMADGNYENDGMSGSADMDNILLSNPARQLWLRLDTPPMTSTDEEQNFQITITATRTNL